MSPPDSQFRFVIEHIREELATLRQELSDEFKRHDTVIEKFMDDTASRLKLMEEQVLSVQKFKWMVLGMGSLIVVLIDVITSHLHV